MRASHRARRDRRIVVIVVALSAVVSAAFGYVVAPPGSQPLLSVLWGVANAVLVATPIAVVEVYDAYWAFVRRLRRLPLLAFLAIKMLFYVVCIVGGTMLSRLIFHSAMAEPFEFNRVLANSFIFGAVMAFVGNLVFEMGGLLGFGTLKNILTGRYVQPRRERRLLLLIDLKDSTGHAERLGAVSFHELLNAFFGDIADAALECGAEIHKYVGDEAILTWSLDGHRADGDRLFCPFIAQDLITASGARYRARFGALPEFRAALHCGEIVAGEIGHVRREIAYVGDALNVAARLLEAAKARSRDVLVSADLLDMMALPPDLRAEPLPTLEIRGRTAPLEIFALSRRP